jgi:hypothetical protein
MVAALLSGLLLATLSVPLNAQPADQTHPAHGFGPVYDAAHETTLEGTIERVQTKRVVGSPAGTHIFVAGPDGLIDAHLGSLLSKQTKESLLVGMPVHVVGATTLLRGRSYLYVRQLTIAGRLVTVRGVNGIPVPERNSHAEWRTRKTAGTESNGGAR